MCCIWICGTESFKPYVKLHHIKDHLSRFFSGLKFRNKVYNTFIMKNVNDLKKVVSILRKNEEVVCVPEKCKFNFIFHMSVFLLFFIWWLLFLINVAVNLPLDEFYLFLMFSAILPFVVISSIITYLTNLIVITNQRLICFRYGKVTCFERDEITKISSHFMLNRMCVRNLVIRAKNAPVYDIEYYDVKNVCEELGL